MLPRLYIIILLTGVPAISLAQPNTIDITGAVTAANTGLPLQGAHVFIADSQIGTATDTTGHFTLHHVPAGAHRLYVSMVGYAPAWKDTLLRNSQSYTFDFRLESTTIALSEVVVTAQQARRWQRQLIKFARLFLGETPNSDLTTIVNPEVLSFTGKWGRLNATASAPLIIENKALGYRIQYFLKEFFHYGNTLKYDGEPLYTPLEPADEDEAARWEANRQKAFYGSLRHYLLALLRQRTEEDGFVTYRRRSLDPASDQHFGVDPTQLLRNGPTPLEKELTFYGFLEVIYTREKEDPAFYRWLRRHQYARPDDQRSFLELNSGPTLIDQSGEVIDPYGVTVYGYYAYERIADEVPKEYRPPGWPPR